MRYLLMVLMVIAATQVIASGVFDIIESLAERAQEASVSSEVEVVELFHAETTEELGEQLESVLPGLSGNNQESVFFLRRYSSAICTALRAAPFLRLSARTQN